MPNQMFELLKVAIGWLEIHGHEAEAKKIAGEARALLAAQPIAASEASDARYTMDQMRDYALAFHESRLEANEQPIYQVWDVKRLAWLDVQEHMYRERQSSMRRIVCAAPRPAALNPSAEPVAKVIFTNRKKPDVEWLIDTVQRDTLLYTTPPSKPVDAEPVAIIGKDWQIFYVGSEPLQVIVERHGLKIGDKLYALDKDSK